MRSPSTSISVDANCFSAEALHLFGLASQDLHVLPQDPQGERLDDRSQDQHSESGAFYSHRAEEVGDFGRSGRQRRRGDDVAAVTQPILHLRDAGEEETVPMKHLSALGREDAPRQTFRPLLAYELCFGAAVQGSEMTTSIGLRSLFLRKRPACTKAVCGTSSAFSATASSGPGISQPLPDGEVSGLIREGDLIGLRIRLDPGFGIDPHPALRLATGKGWGRAARCVLGLRRTNRVPLCIRLPRRIAIRDSGIRCLSPTTRPADNGALRCANSDRAARHSVHSSREM